MKSYPRERRKGGAFATEGALFLSIVAGTQVREGKEGISWKKKDCILSLCCSPHPRYYACREKENPFLIASKQINKTPTGKQQLMCKEMVKQI